MKFVLQAAAGVGGRAVGVPKPAAKKAVTTKAKQVEVIEISPDSEEVRHEKQEKLVPQIEKSASHRKKKKVPSMTAVLTARSKVIHSALSFLTFDCL